MKKWASTLFLALALGLALPISQAHAQYTRGGHDETTEDFTGAAWAAAGLATPGTVAGGVTGSHLMITEVGMRGLNGATPQLADSSEFVEIYNPTTCTINLSRVYLSDVNAYSTLSVAGTVDLAANNTDFAMRFPNGSTIAPGQVIVVAIDGGRYKRATGVDADYQLFNAGGVTTAQTMVDVATNKGGTYPAFGSFTNGGEFCWLFFFDGSDLVTDLDLVYWPVNPAAGANAPTLKTPATCLDGPDPGTGTTCYFTDAGPVTGASAKGLTVPANGAGTRQRATAETEAVSSGGNGATLGSTFVFLSATANPATCGSSVTLIALFDSGITGTVTFYDGVDPLGSVPISGGSAQLPTTFNTTGGHNITASYSGSACNGPGVSSVMVLTVNPINVSLTLASSPNPSTCGEKVTLTATLGDAAAGGSIEFFDGATSLGTAAVVSGVATLSVTTFGGGSHSLTAQYTPDMGSCYAATTAATTQDVNPVATATSLTSDVNPSTCGQKVNLTATVTPVGATGTVTFYDGATVLGIGSVDGSGNATLSVTDFGAGSHTLTASYGGAPCYAASVSAEYKQDVNPAATTTTLTADLNPATCGDKVNLTAHVSPAAAGSVTFYDGANPLGASPVDGNGNATLSVQAELYTGTISLTAQFTSSDPCYAGSMSAPYDLVVNPGTSTVVLTANPTSSTCGEGVMLTATVTPSTAIGDVQFYDGATLLGTASADLGTATLVVAFTGAGTHSLTASFAGDYCVSGSTSAKIDYVVTEATTAITVTSDVNPGVCGQKVTLTAHVQPGATGTVTFYDGATVLGSAAVDGFGAAFLSVTTFTTGSHSITASYGGDNCYLPATSDPLTLVIRSIETQTLLSSSPNPSVCGDKVTLTAIVRTPNDSGNGIVAKGGFHTLLTGTVTFYDGATPLGSATVVDSTAILSVTTLAPGSHVLTAVFAGDACLESSTSDPVKQDVLTQPGTIVVTSDVNPVKGGGKVNLSATITPAPAGGLVTFYDGATVLGQAAPVNGVATLSVTTLSVGPHNITAVYTGDVCLGTLTSPPYVQVVTPNDPPHVTVQYPNGGETICIDSEVKIRWTATDNTQVVSVTIEYSLDYGATWQTIAVGVPNTGSYTWHVPPPGTMVGSTEVFSALIRVTATDNGGEQGSDQSDGFFSIPDCVVDVSVVRLEADATDEGIAIRWTLPPARFASLAMERAEAEAGPWSEIQAARHDEGERTVAVDATAEPAKSYWYRLVGRTASGSSSVFGPVQGRAAAPAQFALSPVWPNPSQGAFNTRFTLPRAASIRLSVLDIQGREVQVLAQGPMSAGRYQATWDGRTGQGRVPEGIYFLTYVTPTAKLTQRVVIAR